MNSFLGDNTEKQIKVFWCDRNRVNREQVTYDLGGGNQTSMIRSLALCME